MKAFFLILILLLGDQWTKYYTVTGFVDPFILTDWARFIYVKNTGVAFSIPIPSWVVLLGTGGIVGWLIKTLYKEGFHWKYVLLFAGAVGNAIDRIWHGFVIDFISIGNFPVFNMADIYISVGIGLFLLEEWTGK